MVLKCPELFNLSLQKVVQLNPRIIYCKTTICREIPLLLGEGPVYVLYLLCFISAWHI